MLQDVTTDNTPDTFNFTDPTNAGLSTVVEAENYTTTSSLDAVPHIWELKTTTAGYSGTGYMEGTPNSANCIVGTPPTTCGADMTYDFTVTVAGNHYVHFRVDSPSTSDNSFHWGIDGSWLEANNTAVGSWMWDTGGVRTGSLTAATHTLKVWMRESGLNIDQIVINQSATPHVESNIVQVTGMDSGTAISIDGGGLYEYRICTDASCATVTHAYASTAGTIDAGEYVQLRLISSASESTAIVATVTVGTLAVDWSVTTGDFTPTTFNFTDQSSVALGTQTVSDIVQVSGMETGTPITIDGAGAYDYRICNDVNCTVVNHVYATTAGSIDAGEFVQLRLTSSASENTHTVATVTVGTLAVDWRVTTTATCPGGSVCWDGGGSTNDWSEGANWTTGVPPLTAELVVFNGLSTKAATFNAVDTIGSLTIEAGYTGTLTLAATLTNDGAFVMNGGNLTMGSTTVNQKDDWTYTAGVVNAGTSNVIFGSSPLAVSPGAMTFNDVTLSLSGGNSLTVTGTMDVDGDLTINSIDCIGGTGTIAVSGNITTTDTTVCQSGTAKIVIDGSGAQTLSASGGAGGLPAIEINNSGTLTIQDTIHMDDNWVFTAGTVDAGTSTVIFDGSETSVTTGTMAFNNVTVNVGGANTLTLTDTFDIDGNLTLPNAGDGFGGAGGIELAGNLASTWVNCCGSNAITLDGANAQTVDIATGDVTSGLYTINKASQAGTVTLSSAMNLSATGQELTLTTGCVDMAGFNLTIDGTLTLESGTTINQGGGALNYGNLVDNGGTLDGACPVGVSLAINSTNPGSLTESNLDTATVTVDLTSGTFDNPLAAGDFSLNGAPTGTTISAAAYVTATQATLTLAFDSTDFDTNASMSVTVLQTALLTGIAPATSGTVTITAIVESSLAINSTNPGSLTETNLDTATVTVDLTDGTFNNPLAAGYFSLTGAPAGTTISAAAYVTATQATLTLAFDATDFDTNASMSVTALQTALLTGAGPATTGTVTVTAVVEARLDQIHYRWRNDDGGEAGFDKGDGTDGALAPTGTFDLNTSTSGGRTYADGIAYHVTTPADSATSVVLVSGSANGIVAGDEVLLINMQGASTDTADVGNYEFVEVLSVSSGTITFTGSGITKSYDGTTAANQKVVVQRVPNYTSVTLDTANDKITASAWDGLTANPAHTGIVVFRANGTVSVGAGTSIDVTGLGYRGGTSTVANDGGGNGESYDGTNGKGGASQAKGTLGGGSGEEYAPTRDNTVDTRGGGGGGGFTGSLGSGSGGGGGGGYGGGGGGGGGGSDSSGYISGGGGSGGTTDDSAGGGGHGEDSGTSGTGGNAGNPGQQGGVSEAKGGGDPGSGTTTGQGGHAEDTGDSPGGGGGGGGNYNTTLMPKLYLGSGGGAGADHSVDSGLGLSGGAGGGIVFIIADIVDNNATAPTTDGIITGGTAGGTTSDGDGAGGGGAGGSVLIWANTVDNTGGTITVPGGAGGANDSNDDSGAGGGGGVGRIRIEADTITSGTITPDYTSGVTPGGGTPPATFGPAEDAALSVLTKNTTKRLRFEISNEGTVPSGSVKYRLEVSEPNPPSSLCASATTWTRVDTSTHWNMVASTYFADADATQDINPGLTNANDDFKAGELKETTDETTAGIILSTTEFTELEYAIAATNSATGSGIYCFRLTDAGTATNFTYTEATYGKVTLGPDLDFGFRKEITIDRSKIPTGCGTTLSNFPLLFSVTDLDLSTASGQVTDPQGDDILFRATDTATCGGTAPCTLDHEIESYNSTTGQLLAWVRVPSLNTSAAGSDTKIYVYYGNTDIASSIENINPVWDANYMGVWHFNEDPAVAGTDGIKDSTSHGNHGTDFGGMVCQCHG